MRILPKGQSVFWHVPVPPGLSYLPYQETGIRFACKKRGNVLIADEQGLGKTIESVGVANVLKPRIVIIICPATLKYNWASELQKWSTRPVTIDLVEGREHKFKRPKIIGDLKNRTLHAVIVNYDLLFIPRIYVALTLLLHHTYTNKFDLLIFDEGHRLANGDAKRTKVGLGTGLKRESLVEMAEKVLVLTGTPMPNRPRELFPLLSKAFPETIGRMSFHDYAFKYCNAHQTPFGLDTSGASNLEDLEKKLKRVMIRRLKKDYLKELPEKRKQIVLLPETDATAYYKAKEVAYDWKSVAKKWEHPSIAFEGLSELRHNMALAKIPVCIQHIRMLLETNPKLVIFAHHRDVIDTLAVNLQNYNPVKIMGGMAPKDVHKKIRSFQTQKSVHLLIGNILAAGTGHTFTAASLIVFVEISWVPSDIEQAIDRCHRIGQTDSVLGQFLVVNGSLDSYMLQTLFQKQQVIDSVVKPTA